MTITLSEIAGIIFATGFGWQLAKARWFQRKYGQEVKNHAETTQKLADREQRINNSTDAVALATRIIDDYRKGELRSQYATTSGVKDLVDWPDEIGGQEK